MYDEVLTFSTMCIHYDALRNLVLLYKREMHLWMTFTFIKVAVVSLQL